MIKDVYLAGCVRTPVGSFCGALEAVSAVDLGVTSVKATLERSGVGAAQVEELLYGNVVSASLGPNVARQVTIDHKYAGYVARQQIDVQRQRRLAQRRIPGDFDFHSIEQLRHEAREKLTRVRPGDLASFSIRHSRAIPNRPSRTFRSAQHPAVTIPALTETILSTPLQLALTATLWGVWTATIPTVTACGPTKR